MQWILRLAFLAHFGLVIFTVSHLYQKINWSPLRGTVEVYSSLSYTNRCFGFFAPTVNDDYVLSLQTVSRDGSTGQRVIPIHNGEERIRYCTMLWHFAEGEQESRMSLFARSWGLYCFNQDSLVTRVNVKLERNHIPTMAEYRAGARITQDFYYSTTLE